MESLAAPCLPCWWSFCTGLRAVSDGSGRVARVVCVVLALLAASEESLCDVREPSRRQNLGGWVRESSPVAVLGGAERKTSSHLIGLVCFSRSDFCPKVLGPCIGLRPADLQSRRPTLNSRSHILQLHCIILAPHLSRCTPARTSLLYQFTHTVLHRHTHQPTDLVSDRVDRATVPLQ